MIGDTSIPRTLWSAVFATEQPVEVEIGPGRGEVLLALAAGRPDVNFLGIERVAPQADAIAREADRRRLRNVRVVTGDARCVVGAAVPDASVSAYHIYFPDPWPKTRHRLRRLFHGDRFAHDLARTLRRGGVVHVASDLPLLLDAACACLRAVGFTRADGLEAPERPTTHFERKYARGGTFYACLTRPE